MKKRWIALILTLILLAAEACPAAAAGKVLQIGDTGDAVLELNTRLRQLNYTQVRATAEYTSATQMAVSLVQQAYGLAITGKADEKTLAVIYGECYRPLSLGTEGEEVKLLQEKLKELGYYTGNITGNYLENTVTAVKEFQRNCSLPDSGIADVATQEKLYSLSVRPTPTPAPAATPTPPRTPSPTPGPYQSFPGTLKSGSTGSNVQKVQQRLKDLGFFTFYKTTENYKERTVEAVKAFQKKNGLKETGTVNADTWDALFNDPDVRGVDDEARKATPVPYYFEVDIKNQVVKVWKYNADTKKYSDLDRAFLCASGTAKYPSPLGTFTLSGRRAPYCKFPTWGGGEARWWTKITDEIAFHSVLYADASDPMTLKVSSYKGLGKRGSHGCIRLTLADAKWIYDHAKEGMKVWIHDNAADDPELRYAIQPGALDTTTMTQKVTPAPTAYPAYNGKKAPTSVARTLKVGSQGADVYWLQMKLKELGFYKGTVTGQFREGTRDALKAYQKSRKLRQTGQGDKQTLTKIYEEANATPRPRTPTPRPKVKTTVKPKATVKATVKPKTTVKPKATATPKKK